MNAGKPIELVVAEKADDQKWPSLRGLALGIFVILLFASLYFAREFFMPVILAFLFALTLTPIVRFLRKRGIPSPISATRRTKKSSSVSRSGFSDTSDAPVAVSSDSSRSGGTSSGRSRA